MYRSVSFSTILALTVMCAFSMRALADVPILLSQQGRLLDSGGSPLTGVYAITYGIFEAPTGGAPLWTETHPSVVVDDGLFTVQLGSVTPITASLLSGGGGGGGGTVERYLEVSVGGTAITPRTRLISSPYSVASSRVSGDIQTGPGRIVVGDLTGDGHADLIANPDSVVNDYVQDNSPNVETRVKVRVTPIDAGVSMSRGGSTTATIRAATTGGHIGLGGMSGSTTGTIRMIASPDSTVSSFEHGDPDHPYLVRIESGPSRAGSILSGMSGSTTGTIRMTATGDSAVTECAYVQDNSPNPETVYDRRRSVSGECSSIQASDLDGDGNPECSMRGVVTGQAPGTTNISAMYLDVDDDDDGVPESSMEHITRPGSSGSILSGMSGSTTGTIRMMATPDSTTDYRDVDSDADGIPESSDRRTVSANDVHHNVISRGGSTTGTIRMAASPDSASTSIEWDSDNDGIPDCSAKEKGGSSGISHTLLGGHSGSTTGTIRMAATGGGGPILPSGEILIEADLDGDGTMENTCSSGSNGSGSSVAVSSRFGSGPRQTTSMDGSFVQASMRCDSDTDGDGTPENFISSEASTSGSTLRVVSLNGLPPGDPYEGNIALHADDSTSSIAINQPGVNDTKITFQVDATGPAIRITSSGTIKSDLDGSGNAYFSSKVGIGIAVPTHHIDVTGGAYCDGTDWVNASDRSSKENFEKVDGKEILRQIADLEITKWNYKGNDNSQHIGPTAQDFKKTFGVGSDGKSISTIDPSGIALAAIKELSKQNSELMDQNKELKKELDELKRIVRQIASER